MGLTGRYSAARVFARKRVLETTIIPKLYKWAGLAVSICLCAAAVCASPAGAESLYRRGAEGEPATLDPQLTGTVVEANVIYDLFEGLLTYDADGALVPGVAASWSASPDGLTWTFKLRDAKWSNGDPIVAADFVYSFRRLLDPATGAQYANLFYVLKNGEAVDKGAMKPDALGVKALDPHTLEIDLERPTPYILAPLAHQT